MSPRAKAVVKKIAFVLAMMYIAWTGSIACAMLWLIDPWIAAVTLVIYVSAISAFIIAFSREADILAWLQKLQKYDP